MSEEEVETTSGMSRRSMIKRSAIVGGTALWAAPVVSSFTSPAFGQSNGTPVGDTSISYIAFNINCGGTIYRLKVEVDDQTSPGGAYTCESGATFATPGLENCQDLLMAPTTTADGCTKIDSVAVGSDGSVTITLTSDCLFTGTSVQKCGQACVNDSPVGQSWKFEDCPTNQP